MGGGEIQLHKYGAQNIYLNGNPQITYFKSVYKRHSNFSMETIRMDFETSNSLTFTQSSVDNILSCTISRNGDLVDQVYLSLNLPDIYSGYDPDTNVSYEFQWIPNLGCQLINKCTLSIGGNTVSELYGQWIEIWHEMFQDTAAKNNFDLMTGHQSDLFMPAHNGRNRGFYPTSTLKSNLNTNPDSSNFNFTNFRKNPFLQPPSILGRQLYIPLPFWFSNNPGLALPLVALQYHDVKIDFELRPIQELYTIIETKDNTPYAKGSRVKPDPTYSHHHIGNFITAINPTSFFAQKAIDEIDSNIPPIDFGDGHNNIQGWNMDLHLLVNYIFLDQDERRKFAQSNHEYLIEQTYRQDFYGISGTKTLKLNFNHPVKYLVWCGQRSDVDARSGGSLGGGFNNYTNFKSEFIHPSSDAYIADLGKEKDDFLYFKTIMNENNREVLYYDNNGEVPYLIPKEEDTNINEIALIPTKFNFRYYSEDIITNSRLMFDGVERYSIRNSKYFQCVQTYQHKVKCNKSGIQFYSFSLDPYSNQPSGACNMSRISNVELEVETSPLRLNNSDNFKEYNYNIFVYAVNYNILKVTGGMAGTAYSN